MTNARIATLLLAPWLLLGCKGDKSSEQPNPTARHASSTPPGSTGKIVGKVTFEGTPPEMPELPRFNADGTPKDPACPTHEKAEYLVTGGGGVKDVVVRLPVGAAPAPKTPPAPAVIDQKDCRYAPHVVALVAGQKLDLKNSDDTLHNIHTYKGDESDQNIAQPKGTPDRAVAVDVPPGDTPFHVRCDVHPWMSAYALVSDNPHFTVTGSDGAFELDNVPIGTYKLEAWHPHLGKKVVEVKVVGGKTAEASFSFSQGDYKAPE